MNRPMIACNWPKFLMLSVLVDIALLMIKLSRPPTSLKFFTILNPFDVSNAGSGGVGIVATIPLSFISITLLNEILS